MGTEAGKTEPISSDRNMHVVTIDLVESGRTVKNLLLYSTFAEV